MLFITIRLLLGSIAFFAILLPTRKSYIPQKRWMPLIAFTAAVTVITVTSLVPFENIFVTFSSPESAYKYTHTGDVQLVVDGEETALVIGQKGDVYEYLIVPKAHSGGWKIGMGVDTQIVDQTLSNGVIIYVYKHRNTDDYYVRVVDSNGGYSDITDICNSEFVYLEKPNTTLGKTFYIYYAYLKDFSQDYELTVNGQQITLNG